MSDTKPHLPFLVMGDNHLSSKKARDVAIATLIRCGKQCPAEGWENVVMTYKKDGKPLYSLTFAEMVTDARNTGIVTDVQRNLDREDPVFGGKPSDDIGTPNYQLAVGIEYAGMKFESPGPCRLAFIEKDLTEDILYYRRAACTHSKDGSSD